MNNYKTTQLPCAQATNRISLKARTGDMGVAGIAIS